MFRGCKSSGLEASELQVYFTHLCFLSNFSLSGDDILLVSPLFYIFGRSILQEAFLVCHVCCYSCSWTTALFLAKGKENQVCSVSVHFRGDRGHRRRGWNLDRWKISRFELQYLVVTHALRDSTAFVLLSSSGEKTDAKASLGVPLLFVDYLI